MMLPDLEKKLAENNKVLLSNILSDVQMPNDGDLEGSTQALVRIQFAYRLNPLDLASGLISGVQTKARLTSVQMMNIARARFSGKSPLRPAIKR